MKPLPVKIGDIVEVADEYIGEEGIDYAVDEGVADPFYYRYVVVHVDKDSIETNVYERDSTKCVYENWVFQKGQYRPRDVYYNEPINYIKLEE